MAIEYNIYFRIINRYDVCAYNLSTMMGMKQRFVKILYYHTLHMLLESQVLLDSVLRF